MSLLACHCDGMHGDCGDPIRGTTRNMCACTRDCMDCCINTTTMLGHETTDCKDMCDGMD